MLRHRLTYCLPACYFMYALSFVLATYMRFEFDLSPMRWALLLSALPIVICVKFFCGVLWQEYDRSFRHASVGDVMTVAASSGTAAVMLWVINILSGATLIPRSIICIDAVLTLVLISGLRVGYRVMVEFARPYWKKDVKQTTLIYGARQNSIGIMRMLKSTDADHDYRVIGFVVDGDEAAGSRIGGQPVHALDQGDQVDWITLKAKTAADNLLIPGDTPGSIVRELLPACSNADIKVNIIPTVGNIVDGKYKLSVRDLVVSDLLRREPNVLDKKSIEYYVTDRRVVVTGGAGSIGSELCRQIAELKPEKLIVLDQSESSTFAIEREFDKKNLGDLDIRYIIADVVDEQTLHQIFTEHQPHLVFHAAAYKHVPLMEDNPQSAVLNNVLGTKTVADVANDHGVEKFVLISTDKAVRPTSVMGASKLLAEKYIQSLSKHSHTDFITVRFGNVLDSAGSVVPTFRQQIAEGGPITVTHTEMNRFFMTIPEAVQLVLQAGAIGNSGDVLILDMGEPVKIMDLAKDMIIMSGLKYPEDIDIVITGLRPGEKLYEELFYSQEAGAKKVHDKIYCGESQTPPFPSVLADIRHLEDATNNGRKATLEAFQTVVTSYTDCEWTPSRLKVAA